MRIISATLFENNNIGKKFLVFGCTSNNDTEFALCFDLYLILTVLYVVSVTLYRKPSMNLSLSSRFPYVLQRLIQSRCITTIALKLARYWILFSASILHLRRNFTCLSTQIEHARKVYNSKTVPQARFNERRSCSAKFFPREINLRMNVCSKRGSYHCT